MPLEDWVEKVRRYRIAVHAYCDAVDHLESTTGIGRVESTTGIGREWQEIEAARDEAERARLAIAPQRPKPVFVPLETWAHGEGADLATEELVLGDVGQHGG
jgi:hypothetical protein